MESVDVKALRDRFHAQTGMAAVGGGGGSPRPLLPGAGRAGPPPPMGFNSSVNGAARARASPTGPKPLPGLRSFPDPHRYPKPPPPAPEAPASLRPLPPSGVFPRPPPSHRGDYREISGALPGGVRATGEMLQSIMLKQDGPVPKQVSPAAALMRSQRSMTEVPPLRRNLPPEGPRPVKPKRPPYVNLDSLKRPHAPFVPLPGRPMLGGPHGGSSPSLPGSVSPSGPPRLPAKYGSLAQQHSTIHDQEDDQDTYDDIDVLPPPPPPPPKLKGNREDSWTDPGSTQGDEESGDSEIYEPIDEPDEPPKLVSTDKKRKEDARRQLELKKKEQREKQKKDNENRKRFKLTDPVEVLHMARVRHNWQGGKNDLRVWQGDSVEIIRVKNNPEGKWLARTLAGTYGYISNTCIDVDYEEVKRSILSKKAIVSPPPPPPVQDDFYDDVGSSNQLSSSLDLDTEDVYDDVDEFPLPPPEASLDPKKTKIQEKEEKDFRKKFKFEGPIEVLYNMMVDPNASIKKGGGKDLSLNHGEILDVIHIVSDKKALCRNDQGKFGYVPRSILLQAEGDIYDDIDNQADVYDNDSDLKITDLKRRP
ncbi:hypothetical protein AAFF_G00257570 [Aldrovandia affinis]|uniref:Helically-extended SH3 domain-containing protein n=1 Tax=Aldrovandia affinis TaxID=143900 RepID=A0AAD7WTD4_9TELE|nr:hypothetical protein AAFF_G00257570 [Aldrovandia affinis]